MTENAVSIGKIVAQVGIKGEVILKHSLGGKTGLKNLSALFIEIQKASLVPYFIKEARAKSDSETILLLEDISNPEEAKKLIQKKVWLSQQDFDKQVKPNAIIGLMGFAIMENNGELGVIHEIIEQPHQVICAILVREREVLIPLNESTLLKIDRKTKRVFVSLPNGLLDIYLQ